MSKILIVDDSPVEIKIIRRFLGSEYEILEANDGPAAIELANREMPDLILLDIIMPNMDGLVVCNVLKGQPATADIPVIFITAATDSRDVVKGFEAGGQDYITKPFYSPELCARIKVHLDLKKSKETVLEYARKLEIKNEELNKLLAKLENVAMTDVVTGLANRRSMMLWVKAKESKRLKGMITLILADIDDFKKVNDTYGHDCGDLVLKNVADLIMSAVRKEAVIARWGGEEFLLMLVDVDIKEGQAIAERIRRTIETSPFYYLGQAVMVTLTLGVAELDQNLGFEASIKRADTALYKGKNISKNCVISYDDIEAL